MDYGADNIITSGETVNLTLTLENLGNESSSYVEVSLVELIDNPDFINVNLDEPSRAYWLEPLNQKLSDQFIRIVSSRDSSGFSISE